MAGTKLDRAWLDFLDSWRIYCIKLFTVGQRIAGRSNLPYRAKRERENGIHAHKNTYTQHINGILKEQEKRHRKKRNTEGERENLNSQDRFKIFVF